MQSMNASVKEGDTLSFKRDLADVFGARYFNAGATAVIEARSTNLYYYQTFIGTHEIAVETGDCVFFFGDDARSAQLHRGPARITSHHVATVIRGYMPEHKSTTIHQGTTLPYVNGCSTKQLFPPERPGDPTLQLLHMPPHTAEQAHHIHSTVRVVYILSGRGNSVVGIGSQIVAHELTPGMVCVLEPMCPHHFETGSEPLLCAPLHVFSSMGRAELDHPMWHGTHVIER